MRRVLLVFANRLFGRGVETLLCQEPTLEIWSCEPEAERVVERIRTLQPDVVIVEHCEAKAALWDALRGMLRTCDRLTVIELGLGNDVAHIYSGQQQEIKHVQTLVQVIEQCGSPRAAEQEGGGDWVERGKGGHDRVPDGVRGFDRKQN